MKGIFFEPPFESRLDIAGEEFYQGDTISCALTVKNRAQSPERIDAIRLELALGDFKSVKAKLPDAFVAVADANLAPPSELLADGSCSFTSSFVLEKNCDITDKNQSLFVLFGPRRNSSSGGQLQLNVLPHKHIISLFEVFGSSFQFVLKNTKSSKGWVVAKFKPSSAKRFNRLDELTLSVQFQGETLSLKYSFKKKALEATPDTITVKKQAQTFDQRLTTADYLLGGFPHYQGMEAKIEEALLTVASPI